MRLITTINVVDAHQQFNEQMLIKSCTLSVDDSSSKTDIELFKPFKGRDNV